MTIYTAAAPGYYVVDVDRLLDALTPWATVDVDGRRFLAGDAPADLTGRYRRLVQLGYAHAWLR